MTWKRPTKEFVDQVNQILERVVFISALPKGTRDAIFFFAYKKKKKKNPEKIQKKCT